MSIHSEMERQVEEQMEAHPESSFEYVTFDRSVEACGDVLEALELGLGGHLILCSAPALGVNCCGRPQCPASGVHCHERPQ